MKKSCLLIAITLVFSALRANNGLLPSGNASRDSRSTAPLSTIAREDEYDVKFYWLNLDIEDAIDPNFPTISGNALTQAVVVASSGMDTFSLELTINFSIDSAKVQINGGGFQTATVKRGPGTEVDVLLPNHANLNDLVAARVYYNGLANTSVANPSGNAYFEGAPNYPLADFSASPPYNSSTWWPCKQNLTDKADSSWFFITTDTSNVTAANGTLSAIVPLGNGKNQWQWKSHHRIDFYLISFVVGPDTITTEYFHPIGRTDSMPVLFYNTDPSYTLDCLQKYSTLFGLYPFYDEKFGIATVLLGGGMENQTMVSLGIEATVIAHETMHQWFGDNVTCATFKDLWLNEGFARWAESLYPELAAPNPDSAEAARIYICNQYENGYAPYGWNGGLYYDTGSIYYYNTDTVDILQLYGNEGRSMNYEKAAMMINSLRFTINNDSIFFLGLKNYQAQFAGGTATTNDLIDAMENTVGIDLTQFFNQWFWGYGFPQFNITWNQVGNQLAIQVFEHPSDSINTPLFVTPVEIKVQRLFHADTGYVNEDTTIRVNITQNISNFSISSDNADSIVGFVVDPNQWILNAPGTTALDTSLQVVATGVKTPGAPNPAFTIYPNPTNDLLNIQGNSNSQPVEAELYNEMGQRVMYSAINGSGTLSLADLPEGVYILQLNQAYSYKVLVIH